MLAKRSSERDSAAAAHDEPRPTDRNLGPHLDEPSRPTIAATVERLRELGIVREVTGRRRDRVYVYETYLELLNEAMAPL